jgi:hypothetical protein
MNQPAIPPRRDAAQVPDMKANPARAAGDWARKNLRLGAPLGSWTGLPPVVGAPLTGLALGTGVGALWRAKQKWIDEEEEPPPWWSNPMILGPVAGLGFGALSGQLQQRQLEKQQHVKQAYNMDRVLEIVRRDPWMSDAEKQVIQQRLTRADERTKRQLLSALMAGTLSAATAARLLNVGILGVAAAFGAGALAGKNLLQHKPIWV